MLEHLFVPPQSAKVQSTGPAGAPQWVIPSRWKPTGSGADVPPIPDFLRRTNQSQQSVEVAVAEHENSIGATDDWHTPDSLLNPIGLTYDLDPCAPLDRTFYFVKAHKIFTRMDDGLVQPWRGRVFMNPPFGGRRGHVPWLKKFFAHGNGIAICRAYTSSDWWHAVVIPNAECLLFPLGKTKFVRPNGTIGTAPGHGVALIGMGEVSNTALENSQLGWFVRLRQPVSATQSKKEAPLSVA